VDRNQENLLPTSCETRILRMQTPEKRGMTSGCQTIDDSGMRTAFLASALGTPCPASSGARTSVCRPCAAGEENIVWCMRADVPDLLRPEGTGRPGPRLRGLADLPIRRAPSSRVRGVRPGEAGAAGLAGRHAGLHQTLRLRRGPALAGRLAPGCHERAPPGLEDGQGPGTDTV